jgi:hypothetical protein
MATSVNHLAVPGGRAIEEHAMHVVKAALAASDAAAGVLSLRNMTGRDLFVKTLTLRVTTVAGAACTVDAGIASSEASADNLIDGLDVNAAVIDGDNVTNKGTNGKPQGKLWANGDYLTVSKASGATSGLAGQAVVECLPV